MFETFDDEPGTYIGVVGNAINDIDDKLELLKNCFAQIELRRGLH